MLLINANQPRVSQAIALAGPPAKLSASAHEAASAIQEFRKWNVTRGSADSDLLPEIGTIRDRQRDLERNNGIASGYFRTMKDNIVGTGPRLAMMPEYRMLGKDKQWAQEYCQVTESAFRSFAESREFDVRGQLDLALQTRQVLHSVLLNGESLALPLWNPTDRTRRRWATQMQLIEADRLSNPDLGMDSDGLRGGIKVNKFGRPLGYYIQSAHPGDRFYLYGVDQHRWTYVPAETAWGRKRVLHCFDAERVDQKRGRPALTAVMKQFRMLDRYQSTEMQSAVINAVIAAFLETPLDGQAASELLGTNEGCSKENAKLKAYTELQKDAALPLDGSLVMTLPPGTKMNAWSPNRPSDAFGPFIEAVIRNIAAGVNLPYELLMKDFSKVNYSSARAALLEAWRLFATHRYWLKVFWLDEVLKLWMEEAIAYGDIVVQGEVLTLDQYLSNQYAYSKCNWIWPGRGWVDPVKEAQAAEIRMNAGLSTLQRECAEQGLDWEEVLEQRAAERERMAELGVSLGDGRPLQPTEKEQQ
jgi:lambda family phage portal protein